jgi:hypothetical protein
VGAQHTHYSTPLASCYQYTLIGLRWYYFQSMLLQYSTDSRARLWFCAQVWKTRHPQPVASLGQIGRGRRGGLCGLWDGGILTSA